MNKKHVKRLSNSIAQLAALDTPTQAALNRIPPPSALPKGFPYPHEVISKLSRGIPLVFNNRPKRRLQYTDQFEIKAEIEDKIANMAINQHYRYYDQLLREKLDIAISSPKLENVMAIPPAHYFPPDYPYPHVTFNRLLRIATGPPPRVR
jgi:hypothetical protein